MFLMGKKFNKLSLALVAALAANPVFAQVSSPKDRATYTNESSVTSDVVPEEITGVGIVENLGKQIDLNLLVTNEDGVEAPLSTYFTKNRPVILSPIYYNCPGLCNFHFNGVVEALKKVDWSPGDKFEVLAFSFDAKEGIDLAQKKKATYMKLYDRFSAESGFHFLTAKQPVIDQLMSEVGFKFKWNVKANEWSHASAAILISPEGKITRYLHGVEFNPKDLKLALNETSSGKIGNIIDSAILFCFSYDQHQSKYGLQVFRIVQLGGAIMVIILLLWLLPVWYKGRREKS